VVAMTVIRADRLIPGDGSDPIEHAALVIRGGSIAEVGRSADIATPEGTPEFVYGDATILPGLIDVHTHPSFPAQGEGVSGEEAVGELDELLILQSARNARTMLDRGVTTAREMGAKNRVAIALRDGIRRGLVPGPRMVVAGRPVTMTGGHMWFYGGEADGEDAVRRLVRTIFKEGADYIKVAATGGGSKTSNRFRPSFTVQELTVVADEAHRIGRLTAAHASSTQGIVNSLEAGIDLIAHCYFYEADGSYMFRPDLADRLASSAFVNPTLYLRQAEIRAIQSKGERDGGLSARDEARLDYSRRSLDQRIDGVSRMAAAGVRVVSGSDSPFGRYPAGEFVREIEMLTLAGLSTEQAIRSATSEAAAAIGLDDVVGTLRPGKSADILVVGKDPHRDVRALWNVLDVYQDGVRVRRETPNVTPAEAEVSPPIGQGTVPSANRSVTPVEVK
jgi:imidazolonepropionase-like amidohydrolase